MGRQFKYFEAKNNSHGGILISMVRISIVLIFLFFAPTASEAAELNAGFVEGLWYAHTPLIAGHTTRIYVALRNNSDNDLSGTVKFTDNGSSIGSTYISALPGRIVEAWVDWVPSYGDHKVSAVLQNVKTHEIGESPEGAAVSDTLAEDTVFADYDTDDDGIVNEQDLDDDNDRMSDKDEIEKNRNPLKADTLPATEKRSEPSERRSEEEIESKNNSSISLNTSLPTGLETYLPEGRVQTIVEGVTGKIAETKETLDSYRAKKADELQPFFKPATSTVSGDTVGDQSTITRSHLENEDGFFQSAINGGKAIIGGIYRVFLLAASKLLSYPALLELLLLLGVVYTIYRTARRYGRRRTN